MIPTATDAVTDTYEYDAFGNSFTISGTTPNNYLYRGEQYDPDLGLYYLRARYYNPLTGRFMSRDPESGKRTDPKTLHKYLYAGGNPANYVDPSGRDLFEFAIESEAAIPEAKLVSIYGCLGGAGFASASLVFTDAKDLDWRTAVGGAGAILGCVTLYLPETSEIGAVQAFIDYTPQINYVFCGFAMEAIVHDLNKLAEGKGNAAASLSDAFGVLAGCVGTHLGYLIEQEDLE